MFIGMFLALLIYEIQRLFCKRSTDDERSLQSSVDDLSDHHPAQQPHWKMYFAVAAPALCDLLGTGLMNTGLLYIEASVWQMLRGSMVLFTSLFCAFIIHRPHFPFMWWSVLIIMIGLTIVGLATVISTGVGKEGASQSQVIMAIFLTIGSQAIVASQIVVEEFLLHDMTAPPVLVVGIEGFWGLLIVSGIVLPIVQFTGGTEGNGVHEDTMDTFAMLRNEPGLIGFVVLYCLVILAYNVTAMFVTNVTTAVVRGGVLSRSVECFCGGLQKWIEKLVKKEM
jgi:drug/metabolite transporter (DMT)-like permease